MTGSGRGVSCGSSLGLCWSSSRMFFMLPLSASSPCGCVEGLRDGHLVAGDYLKVELGCMLSWYVDLC